MNRIPAQLLSCSLLLFGLLVSGCGGGGKATIKPRPWAVSIVKNTPASIEVDLVGVTELEKQAWEGYSITRYWTPGDQRRANADKLSMDLVTGKPWIIEATDPKWNQWLGRGVTSLLLIARLPGRFEAGSADPRRLFISLDKNKWKEKTIKFEIFDTEIRQLTPSK